MSMDIKNWFGKRWIQDDGYDPNGKSKQDGEEHQARSEVRAAVLAEPLTDATRKIRRSLLTLSVLVLIINARLPIEKKHSNHLNTRGGYIVILGSPQPDFQIRDNFIRLFDSLDNIRMQIVGLVVRLL